jgi:ABC-2 type transport system permease protein
MGGFNFAQFRTMLNVVRRGEEHEELETDQLLGTSGKKMKKSTKRVLVGVLLAFLCFALFGAGIVMADSSLSIMQVFFMMVAGLVLMVVIMGFYQAVNMLYFVKDMSFYLALPIPPFVIMAAKMTYFMLTQVVINFVMIAFGFGFLAGRGADPIAYAALVLAFIPCVIATALALIIIVIPVMRFSRIAADKDKFARVFGVLTTVVSILVAAGISIGAHESSAATVVMASMGEVVGGGIVGIILAIICAPTLLVSQVFGGNVVLGLVGMYVLAAVYVAVMGLFAKLWYFEGVRGMQGGAGKKSHKRYSEGELAGAVKQRGQFKAFLSQDFKSLIRVPAFFQEFVVSPILEPLVIVVLGVVMMFLRDAEMFSEVRELMVTADIDANSHLMLLALALFVAFFTCISSYLFKLALGRDGEDFFFMRTMPMNVRAYIKAKFFAQYLISRVPVLVLVLVGLLVLGTAFDAALLTVAAFALPVTAVDLVMFGKGSKKPNLWWENEAAFLKGSDVNLIILSAIAWGLGAVALPGIAMAVFALIGVSGYIGALALLVVCIAECVGAGAYAFRVAPKNMESVRP